MTFHLRTNKGIVQVTPSKIKQLRKSGKLNDTSRCISLDGGTSWLTYPEAVAEVQRHREAAQPEAPIQTPAAAEAKTPPEGSLATVARSSESEEVDDERDEQWSNASGEPEKKEMPDESNRKANETNPSRCTFGSPSAVTREQPKTDLARTIGSISSWVLAQHQHSRGFFFVVSLFYWLALSYLFGYYGPWRNAETSDSTNSGYIVLGYFAVWGASLFILGFWAFCIDESIYRRDGRNMPSGTPPNWRLASLIVVGFIVGSGLSLIYISHASATSIWPFVIAFFIATIAGPGLPVILYMSLAAAHLHLNPVLKLEHKDPSTRLGGLKRVTDEELLYKVAMHGYLPTESNKDDKIRNHPGIEVDVEAVRRITSPEILLKIIHRANKTRLQFAAIDQISDVEVLERLLEESYEKLVLLRANERIDELKEGEGDVPDSAIEKSIVGTESVSPPSPDDTQSFDPASAETETLDHSVAAQGAIGEWSVGDVVAGLYEVLPVLVGHGETTRDAVYHEGGMGRVYRVRHRGWQHELAVKCPRAEVFGNETVQASFIKECESWMELGLHPHIASCYYVKQLDGSPRIFAEYVDGGSLSDWIKSKRLYEDGPTFALQRILDIGIQFAWGLHFAHERGMIHQDVKPHNLMLTNNGVAKVADFGLARAKQVSGLNTESDDNHTIMVTHSGGYTPAYCSPEQKSSGMLTRRSDMWSWGMSVLEMFTGEVTWRSGTLALEALDAYLASPSSSERPAMPESIASLLRECFQPDEGARPCSMLHCADTLVAIYEKEFQKDYPRTRPEESKLLADGCNNRGVSYHELGRVDDAIEVFEEALTHEPHHAEATFNLVVLRWRGGQIDDLEVMRRMDEARATERGGGRVDYLQGLFHLEQGDLQSARKVLLQSVESGEQFESPAILDFLKDEPDRSDAIHHVCQGHTDDVCSVACSRCDSDIVAISGSRDGTIRVWNVRTGEHLRTHECSERGIQAVALDSNSKTAFFGGYDQTARIRNLHLGVDGRIFEGHEGAVDTLALSPDESHVISGSSDHTLKYWSLETGRCVRTLQGHTKGVHAVAFTPCGRLAVSGAWDETIKVWDLATGQCLRTLTGHTSHVNAVAVTPDGRRILSGSFDRSLKLWDLESGACVRTYVGHTFDVASVAISPSGAFAISGGSDVVKIWSLATGKCIRTLKGHTGSVGSVAISHDGKYGLSAGSDNTVRIWDLSPHSNEEYVPAELVVVRATDAGTRHEMDGQVRELRSRAASARSSHDVAAELETLRAARAVDGNEFSPDLLDAWNEAGRYCRRQSLQSGWLNSTLTGHASGVYAAAFCLDGRFALSGSEDKTIKLWDPTTGECVRTFGRHDGEVLTLATVNDGSWAISGCMDGSLKLWDLKSGQSLRTFQGHVQAAASVAVCQIGKVTRCFSGSWDNTIRQWDLRSGECLLTLDRHTAEVSSVALTRDGRHLISGGWDRSVRLWNAGAGTFMRTMYEHSAEVECVATSPTDDHLIASASSDQTVRLWDLDTGKCLRALEGHEGIVFAVAFSPDGRFVLSGDSDGMLKLWDRETGACLRTFTSHKSKITSIAFSPDGRYVLSANADDTLKVWQLDWDYQFSGWVDWDDRAQTYLGQFLMRYGTDIDENFDRLIVELQHRGFGWLRPEGVRARLKKMVGV